MLGNPRQAESASISELVPLVLQDRHKDLPAEWLDQPILSLDHYALAGTLRTSYTHYLTDALAEAKRLSPRIFLPYLKKT